MSQPSYLSLEEVAALAGVTSRAIRKAVMVGEWRGCQLVVRSHHGRGGTSGTSYQVKVSSLPDDLKDRLKALQNPFQYELDLPPTTGKSSAEMLWWSHQLKPAFMCEKGSPERAEALRQIIGKSVMDWTGRRSIVIAESTAYEKLAQLEEYGFRGLARQRRVDKGKKRVIFSRAWDAAVPFDDDTKRKIAHDTVQELRGWIAAGRPRKQCLFFTGRFLQEQTAAFGFRLDDAEAFARICAIPMDVYQLHRPLHKVHVARNNAKKSFDDGPVIRRTIKGMVPCHMVVLDVHHCNVLVGRADGSTATPKLIAFYDIATHRVWIETVFFEDRGGVRNVDVIEAALAMWQDERWGLSQLFLCDNGAENHFAGYLDDALALVATDLVTRQRTSRVINALPYSGRSKPIERFFGHFEQHFLSACPGYIGDDRMNPHQQRIGKMPDPFPGGIEAFNQAIQAFVAAYHALPQTGQLGGRSPNQVFKEHVDTGWRATVMDPENLLTVFTRPETRELRNHSFKLDNRFWTCPELDARLEERVIVRVPQLGLGFNQVQVETMQGVVIGIASAHEEYAYDDPRGAVKSAARKKDRNAAMRTVHRSVPAIDGFAELTEFGRAQLSTPANAPLGTVRVGSPPSPEVILPSAQPGRDLPAAAAGGIRAGAIPDRQPRQEEDRAMNQRFVETTSALQVRGIIDEAVADEYPTLVMSEPGMGKTTALKHYAEQLRGFYWEVRESEGTVRQMYLSLMSAFGFWHDSRHTNDVAAALCYDGQNFFDSDHPVSNGVTVTTVSNTGGGAGSPWFLLDTSRAIRPLLFQERRALGALVRKDKSEDDNVFLENTYIYGSDGRCNAGYGLWQMAYGSKQTLNASNYAAARAAMKGQKGEGGQPLNISPTVLVCGTALEEAALVLLNSEFLSGGESNPWKGTAKLIVSPWIG